MKILVIHNYHRKGSASGDDLVYNSEIELLKKHGHKVIRYYVRNDEFDDAGPLKIQPRCCTCSYIFSTAFAFDFICSKEIWEKSCGYTS